MGTDRIRLVLLQGGPSRLLASTVQARLVDAGYPHVHTDTDHGHVVLVRATDTTGAVDEIVVALAAAGHADATLGVSGAMPLRAVAATLIPAHRAAQAACRAHERVGWFDTRTLESVLSDDSVRRRVQTLAQSTLAPLSGSPSVDGLDLLDSLEAYLQHHGAWEPSARALGVHRHTLRSRMERVEELTGMSLDVADNRVVLALALAVSDRPGRATRSVSGGRR